MIRNQTARNMLYAWHGGMSSPFYAAASSGLVADWIDLKHEVSQCYNVAESPKDRAALGRLMEYLIDQQRKCVNRIVVIYGKRYNMLPWAKEQP